MSCRVLIILKVVHFTATLQVDDILKNYHTNKWKPMAECKTRIWLNFKNFNIFFDKFFVECFLPFRSQSSLFSEGILRISNILITYNLTDYSHVFVLEITGFLHSTVLTSRGKNKYVFNIALDLYRINWQMLVGIFNNLCFTYRQVVINSSHRLFYD